MRCRATTKACSGVGDDRLQWSHSGTSDKALRSLGSSTTAGAQNLKSIPGQYILEADVRSQLEERLGGSPEQGFEGSEEADRALVEGVAESMRRTQVSGGMDGIPGRQGIVLTPPCYLC
jgi:hypothetical protein